MNIPVCAACALPFERVPHWGPSTCQCDPEVPPRACENCKEPANGTSRFCDFHGAQFSYLAGIRSALDDIPYGVAVIGRCDAKERAFSAGYKAGEKLKKDAARVANIEVYMTVA